MKDLKEYSSDSNYKRNLLEGMMGDEEAKEIIDWLKKHNLDKSLKVDARRYAVPVPSCNKVVLNFEDYTKLPDFIVFDKFDKVDIIIEPARNGQKLFIESFENFPEKCKSLTINNFENDVLPMLHMEIVDELNVYGKNLVKFDNFDIIFDKNGNCELSVSSDKDWVNMGRKSYSKYSNVKTFDFREIQKSSDSFCEFIGLADFVDEDEYMIPEERNRDIYMYFVNNFGINSVKNTLEIIYFSEESALVNENGNWFYYKEY